MMEFSFGMQINIEVFCKLILSFWVCVQPGMPKVSKISLHIFAYLQKHGGEVLLANKDEGFLQVDNTVSLRVCLARHAQSTHNNTFTISL